MLKAVSMALVIDRLIVDCEDVEKMSALWSAALDLELIWTAWRGGHLLAAKDGSKRRPGSSRSAR